MALDRINGREKMQNARRTTFGNTCQILRHRLNAVAPHPCCRSDQANGEHRLATFINYRHGQRQNTLIDFLEEIMPMKAPTALFVKYFSGSMISSRKWDAGFSCSAFLVVSGISGCRIIRKLTFLLYSFRFRLPYVRPTPMRNAH